MKKPIFKVMALAGLILSSACRSQYSISEVFDYVASKDIVIKDTLVVPDENSAIRVEKCRFFSSSLIRKGRFEEEVLGPVTFQAGDRLKLDARNSTFLVSGATEAESGLLTAGATFVLLKKDFSRKNLHFVCDDSTITPLTIPSVSLRSYLQNFAAVNEQLGNKLELVPAAKATTQETLFLGSQKQERIDSDNLFAALSQYAIKLTAKSDVELTQTLSGMDGKNPTCIDSAGYGWECFQVADAYTANKPSPVVAKQGTILKVSMYSGGPPVGALRISMVLESISSPRLRGIPRREQFLTNPTTELKLAIERGIGQWFEVEIVPKDRY